LKYILSAFFLVFTLTAYGQFAPTEDTTFSYSILFVEKETVVKDIDNSIVSANHFTDMHIICNDTDTVNFKYDFPYLILKKQDFYKLKRFSLGTNSMFLVFKYKNILSTFIFKMPFEIFFDKYFTIISHNSLKSKVIYCTVSSVSTSLNTANKSFVKGVDIKIRR
jgi:hypothetical protein